MGEYEFVFILKAPVKYNGQALWCNIIVSHFMKICIYDDNIDMYIVQCVYGCTMYSVCMGIHRTVYTLYYTV